MSGEGLTCGRAVVQFARSREGRAGAGSDEYPARAISTLWLPPHPDLSGAARPRDEHRPGLAAVASCLAGAAQATPSTRIGHRPRPQPATAARHVWAYDFVFDACANGQPLMCLTVTDEYTRECLAIVVARSIHSGRVIEVLSQLVSLHGAPRYLRSDNCREFVSRTIRTWAAQNGIDVALSDPGKPWQNGADESVNGKFRDECLSLEWFRAHGSEGWIEQWRRHCNAIRPHSSLAYRTPDEFKQRYCSIEATEVVLQDCKWPEEIAGQTCCDSSSPGSARTRQRATDETEFNVGCRKL